jgi:hypothetical protein
LRRKKDWLREWAAGFEWGNMGLIRSYIGAWLEWRLGRLHRPQVIELSRRFFVLKIKIFVLVLGCLALSLECWAQAVSGFRVGGVVHDATGEAIPAAGVMVRQADSDAAFTTEAMRREASRSRFLRRATTRSRCGQPGSRSIAGRRQ